MMMSCIIGLVILAMAESKISMEPDPVISDPGKQEKSLRLFLCGDVMTGRGIDQALRYSVDPVLYETWVKNARVYIDFAEQKNGKIPVPLSRDYIWGDALEAWEQNLPELKIINLETSVTNQSEPWPGKGINYRMHPKNINVLKVAGIDHCSLANNHIMDWGVHGLLETINTLQAANIKFSGAGINEQQAVKPSVFNTVGGRVLIFSFAAKNSGVPEQWQVTEGKPGINLLNDLNENEVFEIKHHIEKAKQQHDIIVFSIHWGANWGYAIPEKHRWFAHQLIEQAGVDLIYGHSSHHPLGLEVYKNKLIVYGAGDFINDYEGINGHEEYRGELVLMYFPELDLETGNLKSLKMIPMKIKRFKLNYASAKDVRRLQNILDAACKKLGTAVSINADNSLGLEW